MTKSTTELNDMFEELEKGKDDASEFIQELFEHFSDAMNNGTVGGFALIYHNIDGDKFVTNVTTHDGVTPNKLIELMEKAAADLKTKRPKGSSLN